MRIIRHTAYYVALSFCLLVLASCQGLGTPKLPPSLDRAEALAQRGDHLGAAREFEALAGENPGTAGADYQLRAAREYVTAQHPDDAQRLLDALPALPPVSAAAFELKLIRAELSIARNDATSAWNAVAALSEPATPAARARYLEVRQNAALATARPIDAVRAHIAREPLLPSDALRTSSRRDLLLQLRNAAERGVKIDPQAAREPLVRGWLELAVLAVQSQHGNVSAPLANWRARYPAHPAAEFARNGLNLAEETSAGALRPPPATAALPPGAHIALLLPLIGRTAGAAVQIRDGLLTALYALPADSRPSLRIYDTSSMSVGDAIGRATEAGAESIIGPLTREEVVAAADYGGRRPAILALNFLPADKSVPADFYQFALSPEDEARQVARRALTEGHRRAVALVPAGDWGNRVLAAFKEELEAGGGQLLANVAYTPGRTDYSAPIQQSLRLSDSIARARRLESVLGTSLQFTPRRRGDVDFLFTPATAGTARQLRPQLRFHFAGDIPAYSTSDAYEPNTQANQDLDGLKFPDMPWVLSAGGTGSLVSRVRASAQSAWGDDAPRSKLYAFGYDAWQLAVAMHSGGSAPGNSIISGLTGDLSFDAQHRVKRDLNWAQIRGGNLRLLKSGDAD